MGSVSRPEKVFCWQKSAHSQVKADRDADLEPNTNRRAASTRRSSPKVRYPVRSPSLVGSIAAVCSARTRVEDPAIAASGRKSPPSPTWMLARPIMSIAVADRTGRRCHIASRTAHDRAHLAVQEAGRPHHARRVSMSRRTCADSARSAGSSAKAAASARNARPARSRAASIRASRTAIDTEVPSRVRTSRARDASSSGRNVMVSAMRPLGHEL
jgi:hypothetical protein